MLGQPNFEPNLKKVFRKKFTECEVSMSSGEVSTCQIPILLQNLCKPGQKARINFIGSLLKTSVKGQKQHGKKCY